MQTERLKANLPFAPMDLAYCVSEAQDVNRSGEPVRSYTYSQGQIYSVDEVYVTLGGEVLVSIGGEFHEAKHFRKLDELFGRDLDGAIAYHVLGWKPTQVPPDYNRENECVVLTKWGSIPESIGLPNIGKLHFAFFVPKYSSDLTQTIALARELGISSIGILDHNIPWSFCQAVLRIATAKYR